MVGVSDERWLIFDCFCDAAIEKATKRRARKSVAMAISVNDSGIQGIAECFSQTVVLMSYY